MAYLQALDYVILVAVILGSLCIGLFFGRKKQDTREYTTGHGQMAIFPVSLSLTASYLSAITLQGTPAEVYLYGPEYMMTLFSFWGCLLSLVTVVPLFCRLKIDSVYEYLEYRYKSSGPRKMGYILGVFSSTFYMGIATFGPAAALESVTGVPTWISILIIIGICTVYTSIGGLKAVIWTDVFQACVMVLGLLAIVIVGLWRMGDASVWEELQKRNRLDLHLVPDPTLRVNTWTLSLAKGLLWISLFATQPSMMRFKAVGTETRAIKMVALSSIGFVTLFTLSAAAGLIMYAYYSSKGCGPMASGAIYSPNQVISYFIADAVNIPGIPGLFMAALLAATFSSISSAQNAITVILWYDVIQPHIRRVKDATKLLAMKTIVLCFGFLSIIIAFISKNMPGSLAQIASTLLSVTGGPSFAMFLIAGSLPFVSGKTVIISAVTSSVLLGGLAFGHIVYGNNWQEPILISDTCALSNQTLFGTSNSSKLIHEISPEGVLEVQDDSFLMELLSISPFLYTLIAIVLTYAIALLISIFPGTRQSETEVSTLFPIIAKLFYGKAAPKATALYLDEEEKVKLSSTEKCEKTYIAVTEGKDKREHNVTINRDED